MSGAPVSTSRLAPRRRHHPLRFVPGLVAGLALALAACGSSTDPATGTPSLTHEPEPRASVDLVAGAHAPGLPAGADDSGFDDRVAGVARTAAEDLIYVVTIGSSTCPLVADPQATWTSATSVAVTFPAPDDGPCTRDLVPTTTVVALPPEVAGDERLTVTVGDWGDVELPAGPAGDGPGSLTWVEVQS